MTNTELIQKIKAEIDRRYEENREKARYDDYYRGMNDGLDHFEQFLDTISPEKPMVQVERIGSYTIVPYIDDKIAKLQDMWREEKVSFDWDDLKDMIEDVARHFAKWGAEHLADARKTSPKDLEEAAKECNSNLQLQEYFIKGGMWQKEQMMKEAVEGEIVKDITNKLAVTAKNINLDGFKFGDKVKIIIVKED